MDDGHQNEKDGPYHVQIASCSPGSRRIRFGLLGAP